MQDKLMQDLSPQTYRAIGLMSGSSLDGLDIACCDFTVTNGEWQFAIPYASCVPYDVQWTERLRDAYRSDAKSLWKLHSDFGRFCGQAVMKFIEDHHLTDIMLVGSHGHTVFHAPQDDFTTQIGDGAALAVACNLPVICDFRSIDVAKGGQGAPLVPIGDRLLFSDYKCLLNLGGIANITIQGDKTVAFDLCSANQVLNFYAQANGQDYDADGAMAASGRLDQALFDQLNALDYCHQPYPKSLDNGYSRQMVIPLMEQSLASTVDKLHTFVEHIAYQIGQQARSFNLQNTDKVLATGGGALNGYLMQRIAHYLSARIAPVDSTVIAYKEALVFALLGVLRWRNETNILASVTGATANSCGGAIYLP